MTTATAALIVAAGRGVRAGGPPKQFQELGGEAVLAHAIRAFSMHAAIGPIQVVIQPEDAERYRAATAPFAGQVNQPAHGGATRQRSVLQGLRALQPQAPKRVLIHDAARPFVDAALIDRVLAALAQHEAAIPVLPVADTLKRVDEAGTIVATVARDGLVAAQTPQGFRFAAILAAHEAAASRSDFTDDAAIAEWHGLKVVAVAGSPENGKLTTAEDLSLVRLRLAARLPSLGDVRTGQGFDVHRFTAGDHVMLCGLRIPHDKALEGHSDADVALHAATDAILGAIGEGDIGAHFPPSDPRWRGAASDIFLADAASRVRARGGAIANIDVTILCERPRISPFRDAMRERMAAILGLDPGRVSVKATTTERLGFTGREEGIAALSTATVRLPLAG